MLELPEPIVRVLREVVAPLVEIDGGALYVVPRSAGVRLHLAGACAGCPGTRTTSRDVIEPVLRAVGAKEIEVSSGWTIPEGAERITAEVPPTSNPPSTQTPKPK